MTSENIIYHYTTTAGLIGIISSRSLWASDCRFLNDGTELTYALDAFSSELNKLNLPPVDLGGGYTIPSGVIDDFRMFIACFCENGDLLSQWRGYGVEQGFALGFDTNELKKCRDIELSPVQYGINNPAEYFKSELEAAPNISPHPGIVSWHASLYILPKLAIIKNPGFSEEKEWRLLKQFAVGDLNINTTEIKFRPSQMGPLSFVEIDFSENALKEIVIGPGTHTDSRELAVRNLLSYFNYRNVVVRLSTIPFRR